MCAISRTLSTGGREHLVIIREFLRVETVSDQKNPPRGKEVAFYLRHGDHGITPENREAILEYTNRYI